MVNRTTNEASPHVVRGARALGILNLFFAGIGLLALLINLVGYHGLPSSFTGQSPFFYRTLFPMSTASFLLLIFLAYAGIQLLRRSRLALTLCCVAFLAEIAFFVVFWAVFWRLPFSPLSVVAVAAGLTNLGLALQAVTGYPVIGLVWLRVGRRKLGGASAS